jgi:phosphate transport system permease protein
MALLVLPIVIVASQEAIRAVPPTIREASFALGATRWQTVRHHVLPSALPGILTGVILAVSRALGEAAPLITIGALTFVPFLPDGPLSGFTVLPIQIFNWTSRPQEDFQHVAAAGIVVLLVLLLSANAVAILMRDYYRRKLNW